MSQLLTQKIKDDLAETLKNQMVFIPGGTETLRDFVDRQKWISKDYSMSIPGKAKGLEEVVQTVEVSPFYLSKYTVTEALYHLIVDHQELEVDTAVLPVINISWLNVITFCNALSKELELGECYKINPESHEIVCDFKADGYRLPTIAEWQCACKAGEKGYRYGAIDDIAWYAGNSSSRVHEPGLKLPNSWGLYDMIGNVWEWCWDLYDYERYGNYRVFCGGSWAEEERSCGATSKRRSQPEFCIDDLGFRLGRSQFRPSTSHGTL